MAALAFYAPMKSPDHPVPSGDREFGRALRMALEATGAEVELVSELQTRDGVGDPQRQAEAFAMAKADAARLIAKGGWRAWISYHNYYKAPDLLGPQVSRALGIPYVLIEATRAYKRLDGPWDGFARAAHDACDHANALLYVTYRDSETLLENRVAGQVIEHLPPFLGLHDLPAARIAPRAPVLLSVGMLRHGDKVASYEQIAKVIGRLSGDWALRIAGDGPARDEVKALMAPFGDRVTFLGQLSAKELAREYASASIMLWPGVNEAFGMVYLEAQAAGLPALGGAGDGPRDVLPPCALCPEGDAAAMASAVDRLLCDPAHWQKRSDEGRAWVAERHLLGPAAARLDGILKRVGSMAP